MKKILFSIFVVFCLMIGQARAGTITAAITNAEVSASEVGIVAKAAAAGNDQAGLQILWETVTCGDTGSVIELLRLPRSMTVQATGTWNSQTLTMQGSNDNSNWDTLKDLVGNDLSFTADVLEGILEIPRYIRCSFSGSSGGDLDVTIWVFVE